MALKNYDVSILIEDQDAETPEGAASATVAAIMMKLYTGVNVIVTDRDSGEASVHWVLTFDAAKWAVNKVIVEEDEATWTNRGRP